ncbi:hypothetical protein BPOR_0175g00060 [Botrytis porri]|uniref:Uncharacterized protein n=1 Tax=Botrytis porri TaxID=87229 RepID=A0A4Z1KUN3_9HELO|nr:hypothetical protein BPOR_0175g00060 [Botrytis porri]
MPALLNLHQTRLGPINEPVFEAVNSVKDGHGQTLGPSPTTIFMYGLASGLLIMTSIFVLSAALYDRYCRRKNVKLVKFGPSFPDLQGGNKFFIEQEDGMIYEGVVTVKKSEYYDIRCDEATGQESVVIPSSKLEQVEIEDDRKKAKMELRKAEEEHEYQAFMELLKDELEWIPDSGVVSLGASTRAGTIEQGVEKLRLNGE